MMHIWKMNQEGVDHSLVHMLLAAIDFGLSKRVNCTSFVICEAAASSEGRALRNAATTNISNLALSPRDLLCAVTVRPEDLVALRAFPAAKERLTKKRIDVLPDNLSFFGNFEEAAEGRLSD